MADEVDGELPAINNIGDAALAMSAWLQGPQAAAEAEASKEDQPQDSPQSAPEQAAEEGNTEDEQPGAAASEVPATDPEPKQAAPAPVQQVPQPQAAKAPTEAETARNQQLQQFQQTALIAQASIQNEFSDLKSMADVFALMDPNSPKFDVNRYNRLAFLNSQLQYASGEQQKLQGTMEREKTEAARQAWKDEQDRLVKLMPELADPVKGPTVARELQDYALKRGIKPERLSSYTADEFVALKELMDLQKAKAAQPASVAEAKAKAAKAPPVQKPGVRSTTDKSQKIQTDFERLQKTGRTDDAARVFLNLLN